MCDSGQEENVQHVLLECEAYRKHRDRMMAIAGDRLPTDPTERVAMLLGSRCNSKTQEDNLDHAVQRFLKKAWRVRKRLTKTLNEELGRRDMIGDVTNFHF
jgi:hypothetical protein